MTLAVEVAASTTSPKAAAAAVSDSQRKVTLTRASTIKVRPVRWLWDRRVALGTLALIGGREGIGKSTLCYQLAADVTRGYLPGQFAGIAKSVIVAATEDSWEHTIVPRLMAAGADLDRVLRIEVVTSEGVDTSLSLPRDNGQLETAVRDEDAALILLDPLMSRLDGKLDTHKDAEVRIALEPLVAIADRTGATVAGLIHVNKGTSTDPLTLLMASRAFSAVARAVLFVMRDPDDEELRIMGQPKNNLGRTDLPALTFRIDSEHVADTDEGPVWTGRINWIGETDRSITDLLSSSSETSDARSAVAEAGEWLVDYLQTEGGEADSQTIKREGAKAGHSPDSLKRARPRHKIVSTAQGFPRRTYWSLPGTQRQSEQASQRSPGETAPTALTAPTGAQGVLSVQSVQSGTAPAREPQQTADQW